MLMLSNVLALALMAVDEPKTPMAPAFAEPTAIREEWPLTLPEAIRIGLDNAETLRVISGARGLPPGGSEPAAAKAEASRPPIVIARLDTEGSTWKFKAEVMAHVRSIEQQYWSLSQQQVAVWGRKTAVKLAEDILARERANLATGKGTGANVAEAEQQFENFRLNLIAATSDLITAERQLRNILGLPPADNRRIVPATPPTEAKVEPDWEASLAAMLASEPGIALQRQRVGTAELRAIIDGENPALSHDQRQASRQDLEQRKASLQDAIHKATHTLARFFLEIDSNYRQSQTARKLKAAAQERLEAQKAYYEEGRITIDRLLDAVGQFATALGQEAQFRSAYNTSIAALEEAKGTLLTFDGITVDDAAPAKQADTRGKDNQVAPTSLEAPAPTPPPTRPQPASTAYKLRAKLGGIRMWEIELEINQTPAATSSGGTR